MKKLLALLTLTLVFMTSQVGYADDFGLRVNSLLPNYNSQIVAFPPSEAGVDGKMIHLIYDHDLSRNFYIEGALGYMSPSDIFQYQSMSYEISPGVKVQQGAFVMKLSAGASYMPSNSLMVTGTNPLNFVIHLTFGLKDPKSGVFVGLDRCHYSNGEAANNPALNYAGFVLTVPIFS
jgi:hypothetical protein